MPDRNILKYLKLILITLFFLIFFPAKAFCTSSHWVDEFNSYNSTNWTKYENGGEVLYENSFIKTASNTNSHPYLHANSNMFPEFQDFSLEIKFKYSDIGPWGTGITIGNEAYPNNISQDFAIQNDARVAQFRIWQDSGGFRIKYQDDENNLFSDSITIISRPPDISAHIFKLTKLLNKYWIELDNVEIYESSETNRVPRSITIGNPLSVGGPLNIWSSIELDYIRVSGLTGDKIKTIILPGLGASWNTEAILSGSQKPQNEWQMTPFVNIYNNLTNSLINSGYELGNDLFVFNYDWRQPITNISNELDLFIQNNIGDQEVNLIGHSLGGLVARSWWQDNHNAKVNKIITLGSPHQGTLQAYEALAGGKINSSFSWGSAALNIILRLRNPIYKTNANIIQGEIPVLNDLLPVFDFLKKGKITISCKNLSFKNNWLEIANQNIPELNKIEYISGNIGPDVNEWIYVRPPSLTQKLLGLWPDGIPYRYIQADGDATVLLKSSYLDKNPHIYSLNHRQLIYKTNTIEKVLDILGVDNNQIVQESVYPFNNTLIFLIASPAILEINGPSGNNYPANSQGFVIIPNPEPGDYQANLIGTGNGEYHLLTGQLFNNSFWNIYQGSITPGEKLSYEFNIDPNSPNNNPLSNSEKHQLEIALREIENINNKYPSKKLDKAKENVGKVINSVETNNWSAAANKTEQVITDLFKFRKDYPQLQTLKESEKPIKILTQALASILKKEATITRKAAKKKYLKTKKQYFLSSKKIRLQYRKKQINNLLLISNLKAKEYLDQASEYLKDKKYPELTAFSYSSSKFSKEAF